MSLPGKRKKRLLDTLAERQNWRCCHCGGRMDGDWPADDAPTFEHVVPRIDGGSNGADNLVVAHNRCNNERGRARYDWMREVYVRNAAGRLVKRTIAEIDQIDRRA